MSDTHVNAFKQGVKDALTEAHKALSEAEAKFEALLTKLDNDVAPVAPVVTEEKPVNVPKTPLAVTSPTPESNPPLPTGNVKSTKTTE